ncbi:uncharacterized protein LOC117173020 [Belonocnema kinseyi]|uniref:uncharacterized protein LOC117173020 n=1 Tax=Belonocnema kinseyi TaxID=2817044 RepID=UPI00143CF9D4|nr:uncharacterized protein LOC117173020 [Belonocnema kinseyi]
MKINVGAPLLTLAIFFSFIELSSQYNTDILVDDDKTLPDNLGIFYSTKNRKDIVIIDGHNQITYGLIHDAKRTMVCALEIDNEKTWVRKLIAKGQQVKVDDTKTYPWNKNDTNLYKLDFDKELPKKNN